VSVFLDCFQRKGRGSAREDRAQVVLRCSIDHAIPLQVSQGKRVREERQRKRREIGGRRRRGFTRWRRNRSAMLADVRGSDEKFCRLEMVSAREGKRGKGGVLGPFIGGLGVHWGLGFRVGLHRAVGKASGSGGTLSGAGGRS
jgi:hypothetical protein